MDVLVSNFLNQKTPIHIYKHNEIISNEIRRTRNFFEITFLNYLYINHNDQRGIIDIGANIGNHSLFFSKFIKNNIVHCFEPYPSNVNILRKNMENRNCIIYDIALSDHEGTLPLYNSQAGNFGGFSLHNYGKGVSFEVSKSIPIKTLDSFNLNDISMIKIDVENHENEILQDAKETILRNKPIIFLENLHYRYPKICPNPEPHKDILTEYNYVKSLSNICNSLMDLWIPKN